MRISDWSSDVCSSYLIGGADFRPRKQLRNLMFKRWKMALDAPDFLLVPVERHPVFVPIPALGTQAPAAVMFGNIILPRSRVVMIHLRQLPRHLSRFG